MLALDPGGLRAEGPWLIATTWQQLELFNLEVGCELLLEALSQGGDEGVGLSGVGRSQTVGCAVPESLRHDQRVVMIARQKREVGCRFIRVLNRHWAAGRGSISSCSTTASRWSRRVPGNLARPVLFPHENGPFRAASGAAED